MDHLILILGHYTGGTLWDAVLAIPGVNADSITITIHTNITIKELKVKVRSHKYGVSTGNEPQFHGGFKSCDLTGRGSDIISYVCRCERPEFCLWVYLEVNQAATNSIFTICEVAVAENIN